MGLSAALVLAHRALPHWFPCLPRTRQAYSYLRAFALALLIVQRSSALLDASFSSLTLSLKSIKKK